MDGFLIFAVHLILCVPVSFLICSFVVELDWLLNSRS